MANRTAKSKSSSLSQRGVAANHRRVPAVTRAIAILRLLGRSDTPLGVNSIANNLKLVPSTCLHILRVLVAEGLVAFDPVRKHYTLNAGMLTLARGLLRRNSFSDFVQNALDQLAATYPVTAVAVQAVGLEHIVVMAISGTRLDGRIHVEIGSRFPALMSATGRCLAAFSNYPKSELEQQFARIRWDRPPSLKAWRADIESARRNRYSIDAGHYISGVTVIAAPVLNAAEQMSHALVVVGIRQQVEREGVTKIAQHLRSIATGISERMRESGSNIGG
jgi:DNA-binding IclR family transcriptional regulator